MIVKVYDIESGDLLVTMTWTGEAIHYEEHPEGMPTVNEGMEEDSLDYLENWMQLITKTVICNGVKFVEADGPRYMQALCDKQPSNIVGFVRVKESHGTKPYWD